jgi:hypothetical protein
VNRKPKIADLPPASEIVLPYLERGNLRDGFGNTCGLARSLGGRCIVLWS